MAIKKYHVSKNLFDKASATIGYYVSSSTGDLVQNSPSMASDYIPIEQGQQYYWNDPTARGNAGAFYDSNKTYISGWSTSSTRYVFTAPNGASYVRLTANENNIDNLQLNTGSTALPYEPYYTPYFEEVGYKKYESATDTITSLPADVIADGQSASAVIKGNLSQSGTPTPTSPIYPQETGDKTANLFDKNWLSNNTGIGADGIPYSYNGRVASYTPIILTGNSVALSFNGSVNAIYSLFDSNDTLMEITANIASGTIINTTGAAKMYLCFYKSSGATTTDDVSSIMLNTGQTAISYQPYGYKIPILSGGTTPVYLGEVESTRQITKYEFTGQEDWLISNTNNVAYVDRSGHLTGDINICYCSHYKSIVNVSSLNDIANGECCFNSTLRWFYIKDDNYTTQSAFLNYLQQQYAAGTPVTIWYVLATPQTAVVNEPIRKIGDYADTISGITIPTIAGADSFDVLTTLKPSEVQLTYHGWHEHSDTKYTT